jgi:large subunit ribosomal protein L19
MAGFCEEDKKVWILPRMSLPLPSLKNEVMNAAVAFVHEQLTGKREFPKFKAGDNITVNYKIQEGNKERIQSFKGDVIKRQGEGQTATFTVRKISDGVGVERTFPLFSPNVESIDLNKAGRVRRAKIYFQRERSGKSARIKEKRQAAEQAK